MFRELTVLGGSVLAVAGLSCTRARNAASPPHGPYYSDVDYFGPDPWVSPGHPSEHVFNAEPWKQNLRDLAEPPLFLWSHRNPIPVVYRAYVRVRRGDYYDERVVRVMLEDRRTTLWSVTATTEYRTALSSLSDRSISRPTSVPFSVEAWTGLQKCFSGSNWGTGTSVWDIVPSPMVYDDYHPPSDALLVEVLVEDRYRNIVFTHEPSDPSDLAGTVAKGGGEILRCVRFMLRAAGMTFPGESG